MKKIYLKTLTVLLMFGLVLHSELKAQWDTLSTGVTSDLYTVQFINSNTGWIAGAGGQIKKSTDGGSSWISQSGNTLQSLRKIFMIDANTGFICGDSGKILKTINGGSNWNNTNTTSSIANIYAMDFINASTGICANESRTQFKTTNGGTNWTTSIMSGVNSLLSIYGIDMTDANTVYACTCSGFLTSAKVYKSTNSGTNYTASLNDVSNFSSTTINDVKFINSSTGYVGSSNNNLARTSDGGTTWTVNSFPKGINQISLPDSQNGYLCGEDFFKAKSDNSGDSWTIDYNYNTALTLYGISFINNSTGWMSGANGKLIRTTNGGGIPPSCSITNSSWVSINENISYGIESTVDDCGNIYITGYTGSPNKDILTQKYSSSGYLYWSKTYNGSGNGEDEGTQIKLDSDGNVFVAGYATGSTTDKDFVLIKYLSDGQREWVRTYDTLNLIEQTIDMTIDNSGNAIIFGNSQYLDEWSFVRILKYNTNGDLQWTRLKSDYAVGIVCNNSDAVFIAYNYVEGPATSGMITKYNSSGTEQWTSDDFENYGVTIRSLVIGSNGNIYVSGYEGDDLTNSVDLVTVKYNTSGVQQWRSTLDGGLSQNDFPVSMSISNGGQLVITAFTTNTIFTGVGKLLTVKYNSSGVLQWNQIYESPLYTNHIPTDVLSNDSGNIYITGFCNVTPFANEDFFTMKYNSTGTSRNVNYYDAADDYDIGNSVNIDNTGNVFVTGYSSTTSIHSTIIKYAPTDFLDKTLDLTAMIQGFYDINTNSMVSDTVSVFLRNSASPYNIVDSAKSVLSNSGNGTFTFNNAQNGNYYYIVLKHRNSIETWSSTSQSFTSGQLSFNFTDASSKAFGNNMIQVNIAPEKFAVYSGDVNQNGAIDLADVLQTYNDANSFTTGYVVTDITGNNTVDLADVIMAYNNSVSFVTVEKP